MKTPIIKLKLGWEEALRYAFKDIKGGRKETLQRVKELTKMIARGDAIIC